MLLRPNGLVLKAAIKAQELTKKLTMHEKNFICLTVSVLYIANVLHNFTVPAVFSFFLQWITVKFTFRVITITILHNKIYSTPDCI